MDRESRRAPRRDGIRMSAPDGRPSNTLLVDEVLRAEGPGTMAPDRLHDLKVADFGDGVESTSAGTKLIINPSTEAAQARQAPRGEFLVRCLAHRHQCSLPWCRRLPPPGEQPRSRITPSLFSLEKLPQSALRALQLPQ